MNATFAEATALIDNCSRRKVFGIAKKPHYVPPGSNYLLQDNWSAFFFLGSEELEEVESQLKNSYRCRAKHFNNKGSSCRVGFVGYRDAFSLHIYICVRKTKN